MRKPRIPHRKLNDYVQTWYEARLSDENDDQLLYWWGMMAVIAAVIYIGTRILQFVLWWMGWD